MDRLRTTPALKTAFSLQCSWERSDEYNFTLHFLYFYIFFASCLLLVTDSFCFNCLLAHLSVEVEKVLWLPVCACLLAHLSVEVEKVLWLPVCVCVLVHLSVEVEKVLWLPVCACLLAHLSVEVEKVLWLPVCDCVSAYHERLDVDQTWWASATFDPLEPITCWCWCDFW